MLPKPPNKYSIKTVIKYYEHIILGGYFHFASVSENSILTILKATQDSKEASTNNLSGLFLNDRVTLLSKLISDLSNLSITSGKKINFISVS